MDQMIGFLQDRLNNPRQFNGQIERLFTCYLQENKLELGSEQQQTERAQFVNIAAYLILIDEIQKGSITTARMNAKIRQLLHLPGQDIHRVLSSSYIFQGLASQRNETITVTTKDIINIATCVYKYDNRNLAKQGRQAFIKAYC